MASSKRRGEETVESLSARLDAEIARRKDLASKVSERESTVEAMTAQVEAEDVALAAETAAKKAELERLKAAIAAATALISRRRGDAVRIAEDAAGVERAMLALKAQMASRFVPGTAAGRLALTDAEMAEFAATKGGAHAAGGRRRRSSLNRPAALDSSYLGSSSDGEKAEGGTAGNNNHPLGENGTGNGPDFTRRAGLHRWARAAHLAQFANGHDLGEPFGVASAVVDAVSASIVASGGGMAVAAPPAGSATGAAGGNSTTLLQQQQQPSHATGRGAAATSPGTRSGGPPNGPSTSSKPPVASSSANSIKKAAAGAISSQITAGDMFGCTSDEATSALAAVLKAHARRLGQLLLDVNGSTTQASSANFGGRVSFDDLVHTDPMWPDLLHLDSV